MGRWGVENPNILPLAGQDIRTLLTLQVEARPDAPYLIWAPFTGEHRTWTYAQFVERVKRVAGGLHARGVRAGDRVLIHLENCPETVFAWFGCGWLGAVGVTTNARSTADELAYFASHSGAVAAITQPRFASLLRGAFPGAAWIAVTDTDCGEPPETATEAADSFARLDGDPDQIPQRAPDPLAPFAIQYTSGTTSRPKAVLWTHANALWGGRTGANVQGLTAADRHLVSLPLYHTNAQSYSLLASLWAGGACIVQPRFSASRFWDNSVRHGATFASVVPFCTRALMERPVPPDHRYRLWGNGICSPPTDAKFGIKTIGWWGMTETITLGTVGDVHFPNPSMSMGRAVPGYEFRVTRDDGQPAQLGETGDFFIKGVRGVTLFAEYFNNPEATANAFDADGYFITGDRVTVGPGGYFFFADRAKDMLRVGGENVAASEVEMAINTVPGVLESAVVGRPHPMLDEVPAAFVVPLPGAPADLADRIIQATREKLAEFKAVREVHLVDALPRGTLEKVNKVELRTRLKELQP
ncbi:AMP-binding protein [Phenylobacterium sp.]|uniref:AMP-binding protein n=1 Tax=Phenylobacterium sp. TaxID=1871053 RepID=UPI003784921C